MVRSITIKESGRADFIAFAPSMDLDLIRLSLLNDVGLTEAQWMNIRFVTQFRLTGLNDGFEEIFLTGLGSKAPPPIPEPSTIALLGVGLLGLAYSVRRRKK